MMFLFSFVCVAVIWEGVALTGAEERFFRGGAVFLSYALYIILIIYGVPFSTVDLDSDRSVFSLPSSEQVIANQIIKGAVEAHAVFKNHRVRRVAKWEIVHVARDA